MITASGIGQSFEMPPNRINFILSELGWLKKGVKGWLLTDQGRKQGGLQAESKQSGIPFVKWPEIICSGQVKPDTLMRDNTRQPLRCHYESEAQSQRRPLH